MTISDNFTSHSICFHLEINGKYDNNYYVQKLTQVVMIGTVELELIICCY